MCLAYLPAHHGTHASVDTHMYTCSSHHSALCSLSARYLPPHHSSVYTTQSDAVQTRVTGRSCGPRYGHLVLWAKGKGSRRLLSAVAQEASGPLGSPAGHGSFFGQPVLARITGTLRGNCPSSELVPPPMSRPRGASCTRSTGTLTELSPCFCLLPRQKVMLPTGAAFRWFQ